MATRTEHARRNIIWGLLYKVASLLLPFAVRTIIIYTLGSEYLGLNSLFTSVLNVLSLAELGFSSAMVYSMYKPVAENDSHTICALLKFYRTIYRIVGAIITIIGLVLLPFIRNFISGDVPADVNVYILFAIYIADTAIGYFLFAYKSAILTAHQRNDIYTKAIMFGIFAKNAVQIVVLLLTKNYYIYVVVIPFSTVLSNLFISYLSAKYYPQYKCEGDVEKGLKKQIRGKVLALFSVKVTNVIYNSVDSIVISSFLGLVALAKYNNYYYIMNAIIGIVTVLYNSLTASIGNSIVTETDQKNYRDYMNLSFINAWLVGFCTACLYCLYQPFMRMWVGEDLMFDINIVVCFCIYFYVFQLKSVQSAYKDAAGLWKEDMWRSYSANIFNLVANLILVRFIGVYGILISTILALLVVTYPWQTWMIHKKLFHCSMLPYIIRLLIYTAVTVLACAVTGKICDLLPSEGIPAFLMKVVVCIVVPNIVFLICSFKTKEFKKMMSTVKRVIDRK